MGGRNLYFIGVVAVLFAVSFISGGVSYVWNAPPMITGMAAKLSCSGRFVSGFSQKQSVTDLSSYSKVFSFVDVEFDEDKGAVKASVFGVSPTIARYRDGLGCSLDLGETSIIDSVRVPALVDSPFAWPRGRGVNAYDSSVQAELNRMLVEDNARGLNTRALILVRNGEISGEVYGDGFHSESKFLGWSMAKSVTAIFLGSLEGQGRLQRSDSGLFDAWSQDERNEITLESMMSMTSGLDFNEDYGPGKKATRMLFESRSASDYAVRAPIAFPVGEHWEYSSGTANLLSRIAHDRLGGSQKALDYLYAHVFLPMGMQNTVFEMDSSGVFVGSSYMYASARDWARVGQLMLGRGVLNEVRLLEESWVAAAVQPNTSRNETAYGYQFWLNSGDSRLRWKDLPEDTYAALGNRKQVVMVVPSRNAVFVRLGWTQGDYPTNDRVSDLLKIP